MRRFAPWVGGKPPLHHTTAGAVYGLSSPRMQNHASQAVIVFCLSGVVRRMCLVAPPHFVKIAGAICDFVGFGLDALAPLRYASQGMARLRLPKTATDGLEINQNVSRRRTEGPKGRRCSRHRYCVTV